MILIDFRTEGKSKQQNCLTLILNLRYIILQSIKNHLIKNKVFLQSNCLSYQYKLTNNNLNLILSINSILHNLNDFFR